MSFMYENHLSYPIMGTAPCRRWIFIVFFIRINRKLLNLESIVPYNNNSMTLIWCWRWWLQVLNFSFCIISYIYTYTYICDTINFMYRLAYYFHPLRCNRKAEQNSAVKTEFSTLLAHFIGSWLHLLAKFHKNKIRIIF